MNWFRRWRGDDPPPKHDDKPAAVTSEPPAERDPELDDALTRVRRLERLADQQARLYLEFERDVTTRRRPE